MLFQTIAEIKERVAIDANFTFSIIAPYIAQAERDYIIPAISQTQYNDLEAAYQANTMDDDQMYLLDKIQSALAFFALGLYIPLAQVQISNVGIRIASDVNMKTAFQWQIDDLVKSFSNSAYSGLDALLDFLSANPTIYTLWAASESFTDFNSLFIQTTKQFDDIFKIGNSQWNLLQLKPTIRFVEKTYLIPLLSQEYFDDLHTKILNDTLSSDDEAIMSDLQTALAFTTIGEAIQQRRIEISEYGVIQNGIKSVRDNSREKTPASDNLVSSIKQTALRNGNLFMNKVSDTLNKNASVSHYPIYFASTSYVNPTKPNPNKYQNHPDKGLVVP